MLRLRWRDKRELAILSTFYDDSFTEKRRRTCLAVQGTEVVKKPCAIEDYNQSMGGVYNADQLVLNYGYAHRAMKWWKRVFFYKIDLAMVNAHILYNAT